MITLQIESMNDIFSVYSQWSSTDIRCSVCLLINSYKTTRKLGFSIVHRHHRRVKAEPRCRSQRCCCRSCPSLAAVSSESRWYEAKPIRRQISSKNDLSCRPPVYFPLRDDSDELFVLWQRSDLSFHYCIRHCPSPVNSVQHCFYLSLSVSITVFYPPRSCRFSPQLHFHRLSSLGLSSTIRLLVVHRRSSSVLRLQLLLRCW